MVKPPAVYCAGLLRVLGGGIATDDWIGLAAQTGQLLFYPPNVSGWPKDRWLDTSTFKGRWDAAALALTPTALDPSKPPRYATRKESPDEALAAALKSLGNPPLSQPSAAYLRRAAGYLNDRAGNGEPRPAIRAMRLNALRHLILTCPDYQTC